MTVQVVLTEHQEELIAALVAEGVYRDASEAVADGLNRIERERQEYAAKLDTLRAEVQKGFDDIDQGLYTDLNGEEGLKTHFAKLSAQAAQRVAERNPSR